MFVFSKQVMNGNLSFGAVFLASLIILQRFSMVSVSIFKSFQFPAGMILQSGEHLVIGFMRSLVSRMFAPECARACTL